MMLVLNRLTIWIVSWTIAIVVAMPCFAAVLVWEGNVGTGWNDGIVGSDTNWTDGTTAPGNQVKPLPGDDVVFTSAGAYTGTLDLGGATFELNSITIGQVGDNSQNGPSDFGVLNRVLASNGTIKLGAGGLTATMVAATDPVAARNVLIDAKIELTTNMTIQRNTPYNVAYQDRHLKFNGVVSGGSVGAPLNLNIHNEGTGSDHCAIHLNNANTFVANVDLKGATAVYHAQGLGHGSSTYTLNPGVYLQMRSSGAFATANDFVLAAATGSTLLARFNSGAWTINGNITGGHLTGILDILTNANSREIIFAGAEQSFLNAVYLRGGSKVIIAAANPLGVAWPNAARVWLNHSNLLGNTVTTDLLLRGSFTLNQDITVRNITNNNPVHLGQVNDGATSFDAVFTGRIDVQEPDIGVLRLTAGIGGSATFTGEINVPGALGFRKIGQGTVDIAGRVSNGSGATTPIGTVTVEQGALLVNSPGGNNSFFTAGIDVLPDATLGGSGHIVGGVTLTGVSAATLAPGSDAGPLVVSGDVDFGDYGVLAVAFGANADNRLEVGGLLDLSGANNQLVLTSAFPGNVGLVASYGTLAGTFNSVDLSVLGPGWWVDYNYLGQSQIAVVPEPAMALLLLAGVLALLPLRSRGKRF